MSKSRKTSAANEEFGDVVRLKPYQYIHVHDNNTNCSRVVVGPATFTKQEHEQILIAPQQMCTVPSRHYCIIENPIIRDAKGELVKDRHGQVKVRLGDREIRLEQEPFPLYPQEILAGDKIHPLKVLPPNKALVLKAVRDIGDKSAGDEWLFEGPGTYIPRIEEQIVEERSAIIMQPNTALLLRARAACIDRTQIQRQAGEEWLYLGSGAYLPGVEEEVVRVEHAKILTQNKALQVEALRDFKDQFGKARKAGEQWLVTHRMACAYIVGPDEKVLREVDLVVLSATQFCRVTDPWQNGKQLLGQKEIRRGRASFFLNPGEQLECGIESIYVLGAEEALLLRAEEGFTDVDAAGKEVQRKPGDRWMIYGPREYVPSVKAEVMEKRQSIALDENEGIYVRDTKTGAVREVVGQTYMLAPDEELWAKPMSEKVLEKLDALPRAEQGRGGGGQAKKKDPTRVVTYSVPHNCVVQVYDYKKKKPRIVFGPDMVKLGPEEEFTMLKLSGDRPKRPGVISTLCLSLGPDFMTDIVQVETSDHARLSLQLAYSWFFDCKAGDMAAATKVFNVADFVGDACSAIASRIRGAVAGEPFDTFHKNSAAIIQAAVFGVNKATGKPRDRLEFKNNLLVVTSVDIQSVEPVDAKTREALMKSVQLAIEITTKSQEAAARHDAERREQRAKGELERQIIDDKAKAEKERLLLLALQAESAAIESTGASKAEARAIAAAAQIEGESQVNIARLRAEAQTIMIEAELQVEDTKKAADIAFKQRLSALELEQAAALARVETEKFKACVTSIGQETIGAMARAGPEMQAKLLKGLGLQGYLMTDGNSPINLMNAASQLTGGPPAGVPVV
mmetsp:Transcript_139401/g.242439  ORF Transcript_139401/g.242439 Transcript_139401/m.242439 type:complete len:850 (-) Transcript_139401:1207-3756(-)